MFTLFQVALGGAIGASLRYLVVTGAARWVGMAFPIGTLTVNVVGSLVMGFLAVVLLEKTDSTTYAPFLLTGILGGFTTFSAFSLDTLYLFEEGRISAGFFYVIASVGLSVLALWVGIILARSVAL